MQRRLVVTTTSVMAVATLMQYSLSGIGPFLTDDLQLSDAAYGSLFTAYFAVCAVGSLILGGPTQRIGAGWGMALVALAAGAGLAVVAAAPSLVLVYVGLFFAGVSSAFANPATNLALLPLPNRGPLVGIKQSGVQISALLSGVVVTPLAQVLGWRGALGVCGVACLVVLPLLGWAGRASGPAGYAAPERDRTPSSILGLAVFAFLMGCGLATTTAYLPLYATEDLDLSARVGGLLLGMFGLCAVVGRIAWGFLSQRSARFARPPNALGAMAGGALVAAALLGAAGAGVPALVYVGAALMGLTGAAWNGLLMTFVMDSAEAHVSGRAAGRVQSAFFGGLCLSPLAFGLLSDATGSFAYVWLGTAVVYVAAFGAARTCLTGRTAPRRSAPLPAPGAGLDAAGGS
jgi:MFS family permease